MGSRGLGQLSYDKGMRILTATQAADIAFEKENIKQGLLTYALLQDAVAPDAAGHLQGDFKPKDRRIELPEWLGYAVLRMPRLQQEVRAGRSTNKGVRIVRETAEVNEADERKPQRPSLFDFSRGQRTIVIAREP